MRATIIRQYELSCAHHLTAGVPKDHPCARVHGHSYRVEIGVSAELLDGMVVEYTDLDRIVMRVIEVLDHHDLNTTWERVGGTMEPMARILSLNPTVEHLCVFIWKWLEAVAFITTDRHPRLEVVRIREDDRSVAELRYGWCEP
jgi:6-pyruvoyltetrahydropterin/6-carboxytetrahydropterin synthase